MSGVFIGALAFNNLVRFASEEMQKNIRMAEAAANTQIAEGAKKAKEIIEAFGKEYQTALENSEAAAHRIADDATIKIKDLINEQDKAVQKLGSRLQLAAATMPLSDKTPRTVGKLAWNIYVSNPSQKIFLQIQGHFCQLNEPDCMPLLCRSPDEQQADARLNTAKPFLYGLDNLFFELQANQAFTDSEIQSETRTKQVVSRWMLNLPYKEGAIFQSIGKVTTPVYLRLLPKYPGKITLIYNKIMPKARRVKQEVKKIGSAKPNERIPAETLIPFEIVGGYNNDEPNSKSKGVDGCLGHGEWYFRMKPSEGYQFDTTKLEPLSFIHCIGDPEAPRLAKLDPSVIMYGARTKHHGVGTSQEMVFTIACTEEEITAQIKEQKENMKLSWGERGTFTPGSDWQDKKWELRFTPFDDEREIVCSQIGDIGQYLRIESDGRSGYCIRVKTPEDLD